MFYLLLSMATASRILLRRFCFIFPIAQLASTKPKEPPTWRLFYIIKDILRGFLTKISFFIEICLKT